MPLSFDDLIPQQGAAPVQAAPQAQPAPAESSGMKFDDLVPQNGAPASGTPPEHKFGLMDTWPVRLAQSIYGAVTLPGDILQGNAQVPQSANMPGGENWDNIGRTVDLAGLASPLSRAGSPTVSTAPSATQLKSASQDLYTQAKNLPIEVNPRAMELFNSGLKSKLSEDGLNDILAPKTFGVLDKLTTAPEGATVTPNNLRTIQRSLGTIKNTSADPTERMVAGRALGEFNNLLENMSPSFLTKGAPEDAAKFSSLVKEANQNYQAYKGASSFDTRGEVAGNNTAASNSGMNLENNLRTQVRQILNNPKQQRGLDPDTLAAMKAFNNGSRAANVMRMVGNIMGGGGGFGSLAAGAAGMHFGLPPEAVPAIGFGVKSLANARAAKQFANISDMMRANSPLAQQGVTSTRPASLLTSRMPALGFPFAGNALPGLNPMLSPLFMNGGQPGQ